MVSVVRSSLAVMRPGVISGTDVVRVSSKALVVVSNDREIADWVEVEDCDSEAGDPDEKSRFLEESRNQLQKSMVLTRMVVMIASS
jgi:hypothetical protein